MHFTLPGLSETAEKNYKTDDGHVSSFVNLTLFTGNNAIMHWIK